MAKDQSDFFKEKKPWSEVKDELLACYLRPYFQKLLATRRPVRYLDCFAGRGDFDDGKPGSPLIALDAARQCLSSGQSGNMDISLTFLEAKWYEKLEVVTAKHEASQTPRVPFTISKGRFERDTYPLVEQMAHHNVFIYIDPYGVRDLDYRLITSFADSQLNLNSIEVLINLNSFGFLRAGCLAMKVKYEDDAALRDDDIDDVWDPATRSVEMLNSIAGGDYWQAVVNELQSKQIDGREAETRIAELYRSKLSETYRYVLSMPIRLEYRQRPKYRMVFATNHPAGCILMANNMMNRTKNLAIHIDSYKQGTLFEEGVGGGFTDPDAVQDQVEAITNRFTAFANVDEVIADFYAQAGVVCRSSVIEAALANLEANQRIEVVRDPDTTKTGRKSKSFSTKERKVLVQARHRSMMN